MNHTTEITGLNLTDRIGRALKGGSYSVLSFYYGLGGMVLALARIVGGQAPFGVAWVATVPFAFILPTTMGVMVGYLISGGAGDGYPYIGAACLAAAARWLCGRSFWGKWQDGLAPITVSLAVLVSGVLPALYRGPLLYDLILWAAQVVIAGGAAAFLHRGIEALQGGWNIRERIGATSVVVFLAMGLMGLNTLDVSGVTVGRVAAAAVVLCAGRLRGEGWATLAGVICGLVMGFSTGQVPLYVTAYSLGGLLAGIFSAFGRLGSTLAFTATYGAIGVMVQGSGAGFIEVVLASMIYLAIPADFFQMAAMALTTAQVDDNTLRAVLEDRLITAALALEDVSELTRQVAKKLETTKEEEVDGIFDRVAERVCHHCPCSTLCWGKGYSTTVDAISHGLTRLGAGRRLTGEDFPAGFYTCIKKEEVAQAVTKGFFYYRTREHQSRKVGRMRSVVTDQLDGLSMAFKGIMEEVSQVLAGDRMLATKLREIFVEYKLEPQEISCCKDRKGRMTIRIAIPRYKEGRICWEPLLRELEKVADRAFCYPQIARRQRTIYYTFYQRPIYAGEYGSCQLSGQDNAVCGDTFRILTTGGRHAHIILSDGMGSGKSAAVDSAMATALITRLLEGGIGYQSALKLINTALLVKSGDESLATLDAAKIDLFTGKAKIFKAGAAPTLLLKRGRGVEVESTSLPAGILSGVDFAQSDITLEENDLLVMISDGVTSQGCQWILQELESYGEKDLNQLCCKIANAARLRRPNGHSDDITVVACRLVRSTAS